MYHTTYVSSDYHVVGWSEQYLIGIVSFQTPPSYEGKGHTLSTETKRV